MPKWGSGWRAWKPGCPAVARRPGCRATAGRQAQEAGGTGEEAAQKASPRLCPDADGTHEAGGPRPGVLPRMPHHPDRGVGAADPGGHRDSGGPGGGHGARLHGPDVSVMPETAAAPRAAAGRCRGPAAALGVNPVSLIITLREEGRLPVRTIQWYLRTAHQLKLSVGAIVRTIHQAAQQAGPAVNEVLERIRRSPVVHADETGWRENGVNGCVWTFSTPTERRFLRRAGAGKWSTRRWERPLAGYW